MGDRRANDIENVMRKEAGTVPGLSKKEGPSETHLICFPFPFVQA